MGYNVAADEKRKPRAKSVVTTPLGFRHAERSAKSRAILGLSS